MSNLKEKLDAALDKSIDKICPNKFHDLSHNHCAHFVSHMTGLEFSYHCREYKGGTSQPGNIRVHEIFAQCPKVGKFEDADESKEILVFVTRKNNVNISDKWMGNIPQKHIGILCDGMIYHYSNTPDKVVKWTPQKFLNTFQDVYSGDQGLYYGTIPGSDLLLDIEPTGLGIDNGTAFKLDKQGNEWFAQALSGADQQRFYIGREVNQPAKNYYGIYIPSSKYYGVKYIPEEHTTMIDHWAYVIDATAECESSGFMNLVNSYDRAKFTFGFYQLAAHTPKDNLILLFRQLMALPMARDYFPELTMHNGTLHRIDEDGGLTNLEEAVDGQLQFFMDFLNPRRKLIDEQEVLHAARLMHWTANDPACLAAQVRVSAEILQGKMSKRYHPWYDLDGRDDTLCTIIADIHHQGRASKASVQAALSQSNKERALLRINHDQYQARNDRLAAKVKLMKDNGLLGKKIYDAALNEFVDK